METRDTQDEFYRKLSRLSVDVHGTTGDQFDRIESAVRKHHEQKLKEAVENGFGSNPSAPRGILLWYDPVLDDFVWFVVSQSDMISATSEINTLVNEFDCDIKDITMSAITTALLQFGIPHEVWSTETYSEMVNLGFNASSKIAFISE